MNQQWTWLEPNESGSVGGSTYSKVFKNQGYSTADLLAREALQNSWDASYFLQGREDVLFEFQLHFREIAGSDFDDFSKALHLEQLLERQLQISEEGDYPEKCSLEQAFQRRSLRVLYVSDFGSTGLAGDPSLTFASRLYRALYTLGSTKKDGSLHGQGGSFGFGKSALIMTSLWRTVIAYSRFTPTELDQTSERLVGWTYWGDHVLEDTAYEGRSIFGVSGPNSPSFPRPLQDEKARTLASRLGFPTRADEIEDFGTSFLLLEPMVGPDEVLHSLERYWWPAIEDHVMSISVIDFEGTEHVPKPRADMNLAPFIKAYELASGVRQPIDASREAVPSSRWQKFDGVKQGSLALVIDTNQHDNAKVADKSLGDWRSPTVALIRRPRMVIEYRDFPSPHPIRGAFIASEAADKYLRSVEPPLHDSWSSLSDESLPSEAKAMARSVNKKIRDAVSAFARQFAPVAQVNTNSFHLFGDLLGSVLSGNVAGGRASGGNKGLTQLTCHVQPIGTPKRMTSIDGQLTIHQDFLASFPQKLATPGADISVTARASVCEDLDARAGRELSCQVLFEDTRLENTPIPVGKAVQEAQSIRFTVLVEGIAEHHMVAVTPHVTVSTGPESH